MRDQTLIILCGPTAVGKTALSLRLAQSLPLEIISGDSMQVYRGLDIGTGKATAAERAQVAHHLLDILEPRQNYNVADFQEAAATAIEAIQARCKLPLIVGGTGLYISSLLGGYQFPVGSATDPAVRAKLMQEYQELGAMELHHRLAAVDPAAARRIHLHDRQRLLRALEVYQMTGQPLTALWQDPPPSLYQPIMIGLTCARDALYQRIEARVDRMLADGLLAEVETLLAQGVSPDSNAMQGLGYRQLASFLAGTLDYDEAIRLIKRDSRRFAKRQLTWFKRDSRVTWFNTDHYPHEEALAEAVLAWIERELKEE